MSPLLEVCPLDEFEAGSCRIVEWDGDQIGVFNCDGEILAMEDRCSHDGAPLAEGVLDPESCTIECPRHGAIFDLRSGIPTTLPAYIPVDTFPVVIEDGLIKIEVD
ncbi:MAG: non-heme iron oxygenase ferredoxin subunit [Solirubrobacteraceae bacterium]|jgi:3-phenylpropionate/trans-cinnamate dioxygenase ferredoxin subunit|nr:non-heme iron oxygenase ferredoxin subunit [Solirubrobacteraceae bacterium]MDP4673574.1 non-heme iron oxygenase ferredoxin subunit [Solirubrobacteraceae bacterium]MDP4921135.1 non-heme iron oxygenase ferredoxin subunit [Solirubrobacteraceae bacterium]